MSPCKALIESHPVPSSLTFCSFTASGISAQGMLHSKRELFKHTVALQNAPLQEFEFLPQRLVFSAPAWGVRRDISAGDFQAKLQ